MANNNDDIKAAFMKRIKVNPNIQQNKANKQSQIRTNNSNSGNKGEAPVRGRSIAQGRGNER